MTQAHVGLAQHVPSISTAERQFVEQMLNDSICEPLTWVYRLP